MNSVLLALAASGLATAMPAEHQLERRINNGLGKTPALGWNSWVSPIHQRHHTLKPNRQL